MCRIKEPLEHPPCYASKTSKVPPVLTKKLSFTIAIQIFTVPYSYMDVVLLDCALSQPKLFKETVNEKVALRS